MKNMCDLEKRVTYSPYSLKDELADGSLLYPPGWTAILWCDDENHAIQAHPASVPFVGQIVAVLYDRRIDENEAFMIDHLNKLDHPVSNDPTQQFIQSIIFPNKKRKIREVGLARYAGLDSHGFPLFVNVGNGKEDQTSKEKLRGSEYIIAWQLINVPYLGDVEV